MKPSPALAHWSPEEIARGKRWVETWKLAARDLERIRRAEIRELDTYKTMALLCGSPGIAPGALRSSSGLVEQQRWFMRAHAIVEVIRSAAELQAIYQAQGWRYCFIGGLALQRWGEPRLTVDVDLTLLTGFGGEAPFIDTLLGHFEGRIPDARQFALDRRVLLLRSQTGVGLDIALGGLPFEESAVSRWCVAVRPSW